MILALLLLAVRTQVLLDDPVRVSPAKVRTLDIVLEDEPARVICSYEVTGKGQGVRVALVRKSDLARYLVEGAPAPLAETPYARRGAFSRATPAAGEYLLVVDNRADVRHAAEVSLIVKLVLGPSRDEPITTLPAAKRRNVVVGSLGAFAGLCILVALAIRRRLNSDAYWHD